jgi:hypothetical protein
MYLNVETETMPTAHITVNKGRRKIKQDKYVYLNNGQEFEIELFNPTSDDILAKIWINNKKISNSGIVLKPGQRVFLERYIDVPNKFLFETYEVNGDSKAVQKAIEKNGLIKVQFFKEDTELPFNQNGGSGITWTNPIWRLDRWSNVNGDTYTFNSTVDGNLDIQGTLSTTDDSLSFTSVSNVMGQELKTSFDTPNPFDKAARSLKKKISKTKYTKKTVETGRVEKGSKSDQTFEVIDKKFRSIAFRTIQYQIKPASQQVIDAVTAVTTKYCTGCGKKGKPSHKFCSNCGTKL